MREGHAVNIHMFCARRPGILLSTMTALDSLGLDIEQAVISCFNGFAMDVFRAEVCGHHTNTILLNSDGFNSIQTNPLLLLTLFMSLLHPPAVRGWSWNGA
jgi:hypothetical protein